LWTTAINGGKSNPPPNDPQAEQEFSGVFEIDQSLEP